MLALVGIAFGLSMVLVSIGWRWFPWWLARWESHTIDAELVDLFGDGT